MEVKSLTLDNLKCDLCGGVLSCGPVMLLADGDIACGRCSVPDSQAATRMLAYEHLAQDILYPCNNKLLGCSMTSRFSDVALHEEDCEYQRIQCMVSTSDDCDWNGPKRDLLAHCKDKHSDQVIWADQTNQVGDEEHTNTYSNSPTQTAVELPPNKTPPKLNKLKSKKKGGSAIKNERKTILGKNVLSTNEDSVVQVKERFRRGCECQYVSCFRDLNPESVHKHRLNIAELTKGEHDMYLMGVTKASLANPETTLHRTERQRLRAQYVYQGRRVCLEAFSYLENCTLYQLKRIRKHVMTHGVAPRQHGNHGKKPHNTFSLDIYRQATDFFKKYLEVHTGDSITSNTKQIIKLPWDITCKNIHDAYKEYNQVLDPSLKVMSYSTFRHFMKKQFPNVNFSKIDRPSAFAPLNTGDVQQQAQEVHLSNEHDQTDIDDIQTNSVVSGGEVQQVIPLVVTQETNESNHQQTMFWVTPVPQLLPNDQLVNAQDADNQISYQLTVTNNQGNIVTTMPNPQHSSYTFN